MGPHQDAYPSHTLTPLIVSDLDDIQGNVLAGFKKHLQTFLFFRFLDPTSVRSWLEELLPGISSTREVARFNAAWKARKAADGREPDDLKATWVNVGFTMEGLRVLAPSLGADIDQNQTYGAF